MKKTALIICFCSFITASLLTNYAFATSQEMTANVTTDNFVINSAPPGYDDD